MRRIFVLFLLTVVCTLRALAGTDIVYMNVGDTRTLTFNAPPYLDGCNWSISRPDDIVFVTSPGLVSTSVKIKAVNPLTAIDRCIVHCQYYYKELDPTTGRFIYSRTGYYDWEIIVNGKNDNGKDEGGSSNPEDKILLDKDYISINTAEEKDLFVNVSVGGTDLIWSVEDPTIVRYVKYDNGWHIKVGGLKAGETIIRVRNNNGATALCRIQVKNKTFSNGDSFYYDTGYFDLRFKIKDANKRTCELREVTSGSLGILVIPSNVYGYDVVGTYSPVLQYNTTIESIYLPNTCEAINDDAFSSSKLKFVDIPNSVKSIGSSAFYNCSSLMSISLPESIMQIGGYAFYNSGLKNITIPSSVSTIEEYTFAKCGFLKEFQIPSTISSIGSNAFYSCENLTSITIPNSVTSIGRGAFNGCTVLDNVIIPNSIVTIETASFRGCENLTNLQLPSSLTRIDCYAFAECNSIEDLHIMPSNPAIIDERAFYQCLSLKSLDIANCTIYPLAFEGCSSLKIVNCYSITPPYIYNNATRASFSNLSEIIVHVPIGYRDIYLNHPVWKQSKAIIDDLYIESNSTRATRVSENDRNQEAKLFNLQGIQMENDASALSPGIYIKREGSKTEIILVK